MPPQLKTSAELKSLQATAAGYIDTIINAVPAVIETFVPLNSQIYREVDKGALSVDDEEEITDAAQRWMESKLGGALIGSVRGGFYEVESMLNNFIEVASATSKSDASYAKNTINSKRSQILNYIGYEWRRDGSSSKEVKQVIKHLEQISNKVEVILEELGEAAEAHRARVDKALVSAGKNAAVQAGKIAELKASVKEFIKTLGEVVPEANEELKNRELTNLVISVADGGDDNKAYRKALGKAFPSSSNEDQRRYILQVLETVIPGGPAAVKLAQQAFTSRLKDVVSETDPSYNRVRIENLQYAMKFFGNLKANLGKIISGLESARNPSEKDIEKYAEADPRSALGRIAFGEKRKDNAPYEKDTPDEKKLYRALERHLDDNVPLSDEYVKMIASFVKKGQYTSMFAEPTTTTVYRGMGVSANWLRSALKLGKGEKLPKRGKKDASFTFTPRRGNASSWAVTKASASDFADDTSEDVSVVLYAAVDDNSGKFIDMTKGTYKVDGLDQYEAEKEAIGLGKIKVFRVEWVNREDY